MNQSPSITTRTIPELSQMTRVEQVVLATSLAMTGQKESVFAALATAKDNPAGALLVWTVEEHGYVLRFSYALTNQRAALSGWDAEMKEIYAREVCGDFIDFQRMRQTPAWRGLQSSAQQLLLDYGFTLDYTGAWEMDGVRVLLPTDAPTLAVIRVPGRESHVDNFYHAVELETTLCMLRAVQDRMLAKA